MGALVKCGIYFEMPHGKQRLIPVAGLRSVKSICSVHFESACACCYLPVALANLMLSFLLFLCGILGWVVAQSCIDLLHS